MTRALEGKRIVLTGVSRGVGRATAPLLLEQGARLLGVSKDAGRLESARLDLSVSAPDRFFGLALDLTDRDAGQRLKDRVLETLGGLDILIFNAGVQYKAGNIMSEPEGMLEMSLEQNLLAPFRIAKVLLPVLLAGNEPRLINVSSGAGTLAAMSDPEIASYRLSKWALNGLTLLQAREFQGRLHVSAFDPGWVKTDLGGPDAPGTPQEAAAGLLASVLLPWHGSGKFYKDGNEIPW